MSITLAQSCAIGSDTSSAYSVARWIPTMSSKSERWALITGCSEGGIGDGLVGALLAKDIRVIATARNPSKIDPQLAASSGVETLALDVNDQASIDAAVAKVRALTSNALHYLVNNAGISHYTPLLDLSLASVRQTFETNVLSLLAVTQAFFPLLHATHGTIVNNASSGGVDASYLPFGGAYNASKSAAAKLSQTMRVELAPLGVKVVTLYAGGVDTRLWENLAKEGHARVREGSLYEPVREEAEEIMSGRFIRNAEVEAWAAAVVADMVGDRPPREIWRGKLASTVWWMNFLAPRWLVDYAFSAQTGLDKLKGRIETAKKGA